MEMAGELRPCLQLKMANMKIQSKRHRMMLLVSYLCLSAQQTVQDEARKVWVSLDLLGLKVPCPSGDEMDVCSIYPTLVDQTSDTPGKFVCFGCAPWFNILGLTWEARGKKAFRQRRESKTPTSMQAVRGAVSLFFSN
ncbi:hypothetical protein TWF481_001065 [Arthrobotrys musiformis]|uniref:Uncharacterized protein n=1 Tax=Arthrobotrys musiformis TaxID=47236 RepID=A0AAV9WPH2_9PEZI